MNGKTEQQSTDPRLGESTPPIHQAYIAVLDRYVRHCNAVVRDIQHVLADHDAYRRQWTLYYAVDFSEIFNYILPDRTTERSPLSDGWGEDPELQFFVLSRFFAFKGIILPEPYAVELHGFMESLLAKMYGHAAELFIDAMKQLRRVLAGDDSEDIKALARLDRLLTDDEIQRTVAFFEAQAPSLVAFVRGADLPAVDLLKRLLRDRPFVDLESVCNPPPLIDRANVERILEYLKTRRPRAKIASQYIDALAMEQIRAANEALRGERRRILLVSRSAAMVSACLQYVEKESDVFIRHPRIFSTAYTPERGHNEHTLNDLRRRQQSLLLFAKAAEETLNQLRQSASAPGRTEEQTSQELIKTEQLLEKMKRDWTRVEGMAAAFVKTGEIALDPTSSGESPQAIARRLLDFLRDDARNVARFARKRIQTLLDDVRRQRDRLGVKLQSAIAAPTEYMSILYPIHFESRELEEEVEELSRYWSVNLDAASRLAEVATSATDDEYEQLLAMSLSLAILGLWQVAEDYATYALQLGTGNNRVLTEGHFWHAVCVRKNSSRDEKPVDSIARIRSAIDEINLAATDRAARTGVAVDSRYLKEKGALLVEWRQIATSPENETLKDSIPSPSDITDTLTLAWNAADEPKLRAQINNALFYHYIAEKDRENASLLRARLEESLRPYSVVPSFIRDTRVWGDFFLSGDSPTVEQIDAWLQELDIIYNASDMTPFEKELVQRHRIEVSARRNQVMRDQVKLPPSIHV